METPHLFKNLALGLFMACFFVFLPVTHANINDWQKGASIVPINTTTFSSPEFKQELQNLKKDNANYVDLIIPLYQKDAASSVIFAGGDTPTDASIIDAIDYAHSLGLKVALKPHVELQTGAWRATIDPTNRYTWFLNYASILNHYALIAKTHKVEQFVVGTELVYLTDAKHNPLNTLLWRWLIQNIRVTYKGSISYAANWGPGIWDEKNKIGFWDAVDVVGVDAYYPVGTDAENNSVEYLTSSWATYADDVAKFSKKVGKPIIFSELGYRSATGAHTKPWDFGNATSSNTVEQANLYEALFRYWSNSPYVAGVHIWGFESTKQIGPDDAGYSPQNKPAEQVIQNWFGKKL